MYSVTILRCCLTILSLISLIFPFLHTLGVMKCVCISAYIHFSPAALLFISQEAQEAVCVRDMNLLIVIRIRRLVDLLVIIIIMGCRTTQPLGLVSRRGNEWHACQKQYPEHADKNRDIRGSLVFNLSHRERQRCREEGER